MNLLPQFATKIIFSILFSFSIIAISFSQNVKHFTIEDGLPGNSIKCIFKDSAGLLWIGTQSGLATYDGLNFKIIGDEQGLKDNSVWKIVEDDDRNLYMSTYGNGFTKYKDNKFQNYTVKVGLINNSIRTLYIYKEKNILLFSYYQKLMHSFL